MFVIIVISGITLIFGCILVYLMCRYHKNVNQRKNDKHTRTCNNNEVATAMSVIKSTNDNKQQYNGEGDQDYHIKYMDEGVPDTVNSVTFQ